MAKPVLGPCESRLRAILDELGYVKPDGIAYSTIVSDIQRRTNETIRVEELQAILRRGRKIKVNELLVICHGLGVEPLDILFDPNDRKRPKSELERLLARRTRNRTV